MTEDILEACRYRFESPYVHLKRSFVEFSQVCFPPGRPLLLCVQALMEKIFEEFTFDEEATQVATPLVEVLERRRGVCQDFAHLMLACLRSRGLAARYVSGYLLTQPPPGQPRLIGADASHAWVSVFCPASGWVDFDPTNNVQPALEHISLAWGRDFSDVSPLRGVILGGGTHDPEVRVTVMPVSA
jgi:transglutaminase-like putative cysteine protease